MPDTWPPAVAPLRWPPWHQTIFCEGCGDVVQAPTVISKDSAVIFRGCDVCAETIAAAPVASRG